MRIRKNKNDGFSGHWIPVMIIPIKTAAIIKAYPIENQNARES